MRTVTDPLHLDAGGFRALFAQLGPSLSTWRAAEIAALRTQTYEPPVLELGWGDGLVASFVLPRVDIGLDPDPRALAHAAACGVYDRVLASTVEQADLSAASIGTVLSNSVLEDVPDPDADLSGAARVLRPGGRLVLTVPTDAFSRWLVLPLSGCAALPGGGQLIVARKRP